MPVVPSYGGDEEYSQQRQLTYQPTRGAWPAAAPRGLRPIGGNVFGGNPFGAQRPRWGRGRLQRHPRSAAAVVLVHVGFERRQVTRDPRTILV
jgi:hypothetical protein